jgi:hypothetical protein
MHFAPAKAEGRLDNRLGAIATGLASQPKGQSRACEDRDALPGSSSPLCHLIGIILIADSLLPSDCGRV